MSLQAPGDALLAFIAGGITLLVLYVLKLRRRPLRVSTIAYWQPAKADAQANEPFQRLRPSWVMALHFLILALIALAAGRPIWNSDTGPGWNRTILLIDTSASMSAIDRPGAPTRFELARTKALEYIDTKSAAQSIAIIAAGAQPSLACNFTPAASLAKSAIESLTPTDQPGNLEAALQLAQSVASTSSETDTDNTCRIILISDTVERPTAPGIIALRSGLPLSIDRINASDAAATPLNRGIARVSARRDRKSPTTVRLFVQIVSNRASGTTTDSVPITVSLQGRIIAQRVLDVPLNAAAPFATESTTIDLLQAGSGLLEVRITETDALQSDNAAAIILDPPLRPTVALVQAALNGTSASASRLLLEDVISELEIAKLVPMTPQEFNEFNWRTPAIAIDCVIFDHAPPLKAPPVPTIAFSTDLSGTGLSLRQTQETPQTLFWQRSHPLLTLISLEPLVVDDPTVLTIAPLPGMTTQELITCREGPLLVTSTGGGPRRITAAFDLARSNWLLQPSFPVFLSESLRFLFHRPDDEAGRMFSTTQPVFLRSESATQITLSGPATVQIDPGAGKNALGEVSAGILPRAGIYTVTQGAMPASTLAVNLADANESSLIAAELRIAGTPPSTKDNDEPKSGPPAWPLLVALAALLLCAEWLLVARGLRA